MVRDVAVAVVEKQAVAGILWSTRRKGDTVKEGGGGTYFMQVECVFTRII